MNRYDQSNIHANFVSLRDQASIYTGDDGYQIHVKGNIDLNGKTIMSSVLAESTNKNSLCTRSLTSQDVHIIERPAKCLVVQLKQKQLLNNTDNNKSGILREEIADIYFKNSGYMKLESKCGSNCFDGVYMKNGELYIVEVKPLGRNVINLSSNKNSPNDIGVQMSDKWIKSRAVALKNTGNSDAIKTAELIDKAIKQGKPINKIVVGVNDERAVVISLGNKVVS